MVLLLVFLILCSVLEANCKVVNAAEVDRIKPFTYSLEGGEKDFYFNLYYKDVLILSQAIAWFALSDQGGAVPKTTVEQSKTSFYVYINELELLRVDYDSQSAVYKISVYYAVFQGYPNDGGEAVVLLKETGYRNFFLKDLNLEENRKIIIKRSSNPVT